MNLHGVTKPLNTTLTLTGKGKNRQGQDLLGFETQFTIKRTDFGMNNLVGPVGDEVDIRFTTEVVKQ